MPKPPRPDPYLIGLRLLARRELSTAQLRTRLRTRALPLDEVDHAIARLAANGALDDRRTAFAYARTAVRLTAKGRARVLREIEARGIDASTARAATNAAFEDVDEAEVLERALARRLQGRVEDAGHFRRLHRSLRRQGFPSRMIIAALERRGADPQEDPDA